MANEKQGNSKERKTSLPASTEAKSASIAERGIKTGSDFAALMSSLMGDIISGRVTPAVGNAACNAGGKLLKVVEMQYKFGTQSGSQGNRTLILAPENN